MIALVFCIIISQKSISNSSIKDLDQQENHHVAPTGAPPLLEYWCLRGLQRLIESVGIYNPRCTKRWYKCSIPKWPFQNKTNGFSWCTRNWMASKSVSFSCHLQLTDVIFQDPILCGYLKQKDMANWWKYGESRQSSFFSKKKNTPLPKHQTDLYQPLLPGLPFPHHLGRSVQTLWSPGGGTKGWRRVCHLKLPHYRAFVGLILLPHFLKKVKHSTPLKSNIDWLENLHWSNMKYRNLHSWWISQPVMKDFGVDHLICLLVEIDF